MVIPPGLEPGFTAWRAVVLDQLDDGTIKGTLIIQFVLHHIIYSYSATQTEPDSLQFQSVGFAYVFDRYPFLTSWLLAGWIISGAINPA